MALHRSVRHAVFFGLYPDSRASDRASRLARTSGLTPAGRMHVTLVGLPHGDAPPAEAWLAKVVSAGGRVRHPPFLIELTILGSFGRPGGDEQAVVLRGEDGVIGIHQLCEAILRQLKAEGLRGRPSGTPHLTVAHSRRFLPDQPVDPVRWTARELLLIHSFQGEGRHEILARWPLAGADASHPPSGSPGASPPASGRAPDARLPGGHR